MVIGFQIPPENTLMKATLKAGNLGNVRSTASAVCQGLFPPLKQPTDEHIGEVPALKGRVDIGG